MYTCIHTYIHTCIQPASQTDKQAGRQTGRQTDRQTGRQTGRHAGRQTDRQTGRQTDKQTVRQADSPKQTDRQTDRQAGRQTDAFASTPKWVTSGGRVQRAAVLAFAGANSGDRLLGGPMGKHRGLFIHWSLVKSWYSYIIIIYHDLPNENGHKLGLHNPFPEYD